MPRPGPARLHSRTMPSWALWAPSTVRTTRWSTVASEYQERRQDLTRTRDVPTCIRVQSRRGPATGHAPLAVATPRNSPARSDCRHHRGDRRLPRLAPLG